jgi:hypothetical protein
VELGLKFRSDVAGTIKGVRFYKSAANTGVHTGSLWTAAGTLLGTVTFTNETASGWQEAQFASPIPINPNVTYVVSYHTNSGHYSASGGYFNSAGFDNGTLHALSTTAAGGNGVYIYGVSSFPVSSFNGANYWVDVVF